MSKMKAARIFKPGDLRIVDVPVPEVGPTDVLCKVERVGICGTDYSIYHGEVSFVKSGLVKFPMTPGHEWSGVVNSVGADVQNFKSGDRVVGDTCVSCGVCYDCLIGEYFKCKKIRAVGTVLTWDGAYAEYIIMPERHMFHLPDNVSFDQGAMVEPAATSLLSVKYAQVDIGDTVLIHGTGPLGIMCAKLAKICGAAKVLITGRKEFKLKLAKQMGADVAINTTKQSFVEVIKDCLPEGVDCVIEAAGSPKLFADSFEVMCSGAVMSVVAFYEKDLEKFNLDKIVFSNVTVRPVPGSIGMYKPVLRLMESGLVDFTPLITSRYSFDQIPQAMRDMKEKNESRVKFMVEY